MFYENLKIEEIIKLLLTIESNQQYFDILICKLVNYIMSHLGFSILLDEPIYNNNHLNSSIDKRYMIMENNLVITNVTGVPVTDVELKLIRFLENCSVNDIIKLNLNKFSQFDLLKIYLNWFEMVFEINLLSYKILYK